MDKLPSRHAISEVMAWISLMENVIQMDEESIKNSIGYKAIHEYLQKYKVIKHFCLFVFSFAYSRTVLFEETQKLKLWKSGLIVYVSYIVTR